MSNCKCECSAAPKLIFSCSGAADVGELADRSARLLTKNGTGKMFCLSGIGGRISGILKSTEVADDILAIDGCTLNCALKTLQEAGFSNVKHIQLGDLGFKKGNSPVNESSIEEVTQHAARMLTEGLTK
ncbi:MAG: putative zinc-binding protein [Opitutales bacterium]|nr:putative zinc-binding protein [Opitutales bacterium]